MVIVDPVSKFSLKVRKRQIKEDKKDNLLLTGFEELKDLRILRKKAKELFAPLLPSFP